MSQYYTDDPLEDFKRYDAGRESAMMMLPECEWCGDRAYNEKAVRFNGHVFCDWICLDSYIRKCYLEEFLDDYIAADRQGYDRWLSESGEADSRQLRIDYCDSDCFEGFEQYVLEAAG